MIEILINMFEFLNGKMRFLFECFVIIYLLLFGLYNMLIFKVSVFLKYNILCFVFRDEILLEINIM